MEPVDKSHYSKHQDSVRTGSALIGHKTLNMIPHWLDPAPAMLLKHTETLVNFLPEY